MHALVSRSELCGYISKFQFVNGLNIQEIVRGSINSDSKFCLPDVFRFRQNLLTHSTYLVQFYSVLMGITMVWTVMDS